MEIKHVAIYLRLSRDEEHKGIDEVLASHRTTLTNLCKQKNWSYETFEEIASSRTIEHRTKMVELLKRTKQQDFDAIVVMDVDRLSRDEYDSSDIKRVLFKTGTSIITPTKEYDLSKDDDNLLLGIQSLVAAQEYRQILKRMQNGKKFRSQLGEWMNGRPPLGFSKDDKSKKLIPNERADDVRYIFNAISEGKKVTEVFKEMNKLGLKTRDGNNFSFNAIIRIVNNENYKGTLINNRVLGKHEGERPKEEWIVVENCHEAIVDENTWNKATKMVNTYKFSSPRNKNRIYPTSKLIFCGNCGNIQGTQKASSTGKLYVKTCAHCLNRTYQYLPVLKGIKEEIYKYRQTILDALSDVSFERVNNNTEHKRKQLESQIRKANQALDILQFQLEEQEIDLPKYRERKAERNEQIKELTEELEQLEQESPRDIKQDMEASLSKVDYCLQKWQILDDEGLTDEEINRALHFFIEKIEWFYAKADEEPRLLITYK